jgi:RES domain-containing protein
MILTALDRIAAYRMHTPKWAAAPTSGAGAAAHGGRANRPGVPALYLALDAETAIKEYQQVSTLLPPGTLVSYRITASPVVDFRLGYRSTEWSPLWEEFFYDWRGLWFNQRVEPPSWVLADEAMAAGAKGIVFPSRLSPAGTNLVLYPDLLETTDSIEVYDPTGALPRIRIPGFEGPEGRLRLFRARRWTGSDSAVYLPSGEVAGFGGGARALEGIRVALSNSAVALWTILSSSAGMPSRRLTGCKCGVPAGAGNARCESVRGDPGDWLPGSARSLSPSPHPHRRWLSCAAAETLAGAPRRPRGAAAP